MRNKQTKEHGMWKKILLSIMLISMVITSANFVPILAEEGGGEDVTSESPAEMVEVPFEYQWDMVDGNEEPEECKFMALGLVENQHYYAVKTMTLKKDSGWRGSFSVPKYYPYGDRKIEYKYYVVPDLPGMEKFNATEYVKQYEDDFLDKKFYVSSNLIYKDMSKTNDYYILERGLNDDMNKGIIHQVRDFKVRLRYEAPNGEFMAGEDINNHYIRTFKDLFKSDIEKEFKEKYPDAVNKIKEFIDRIPEQHAELFEEEFPKDLPDEVGKKAEEMFRQKFQRLEEDRIRGDAIGVKAFYNFGNNKEIEISHYEDVGYHKKTEYIDLYAIPDEEEEVIKNYKNYQSNKAPEFTMRVKAPLGFCLEDGSREGQFEIQPEEFGENNDITKNIRFKYDVNLKRDFSTRITWADRVVENTLEKDSVLPVQADEVTLELLATEDSSVNSLDIDKLIGKQKVVRELTVNRDNIVKDAEGNEGFEVTFKDLPIMHENGRIRYAIRQKNEKLLREESMNRHPGYQTSDDGYVGLINFKGKQYIADKIHDIYYSELTEIKNYKPSFLGFTLKDNQGNKVNGEFSLKIETEEGFDGSFGKWFNYKASEEEKRKGEYVKPLFYYGLKDKQKTEESKFEEWREYYNNFEKVYSQQGSYGDPYGNPYGDPYGDPYGSSYDLYPGAPGKSMWQNSIKPETYEDFYESTLYYEKNQYGGYGYRDTLKLSNIDVPEGYGDQDWENNFSYNERLSLMRFANSNYAYNKTIDVKPIDPKDFNVNVVWKDTADKDKVVIKANIVSENDGYVKREVSLTKDNGWKAKAKNLPTFARKDKVKALTYRMEINGAKGKYLNVGGKNYLVEGKKMEDGSFEITASFIPEALPTNKVVVKKIWEGITPTENDNVKVDVKLDNVKYQTVELNKTNDWTAEVTLMGEGAISLHEVGEINRAITVNGKEYTVEYKRVDGRFEVINTAKQPNVKTLLVKKTWKNDEASHSPIRVQVISDGKILDELELKAESNWEARTKALPLNTEAGEVAKYTVKEVGESDNRIVHDNKNYDVRYIENEKGFEVENTLKVEIIPNPPVIIINTDSSSEFTDVVDNFVPLGDVKIEEIPVTDVMVAPVEEMTEEEAEELLDFEDNTTPRGAADIKSEKKDGKNKSQSNKILAVTGGLKVHLYSLATVLGILLVGYALIEAFARRKRK